MLRLSQILRPCQRLRGRWANETKEMISRNRAAAEKIRKQKAFEAVAIPWKKQKKIQAMERDGLNTRNYQWQGWSDEELVAAFDQQQHKGKRERQRLEDILSLDEDDEPGKQIQEDLSPIKWDKEYKPLTQDEKKPFGNSDTTANHYWKHGNWPCDRAQWKSGLIGFLKQRKVMDQPLTEAKDWTPARNHEFLVYMQDWATIKVDKKTTKVLHLEGQLLKEALHLDCLLIEHGYVKQWSRHRRMIHAIMFNDWHALRQITDITDLRGVELIKFDTTKGGKHKFKQFKKNKSKNMVAFGHAPNQTDVNKMLHELRNEEPLQNVRLVVDDMDSKTCGSLIRIASLMGIHSVSTMKNGVDHDFYDEPVVNSSAGAVFTIPLNSNASFGMEHDEQNSYPVLQIAERLNKDYPARVYLLEGGLEHLHPPTDYDMARAIEQVYAPNTDEMLPGNVPSYTSEHIDWSYPNIIIYATEGKRDATLVQELVSRLGTGSGTIVVPGQNTLIPIDRVSLPAALTTVLARARVLVDEYEAEEEDELKRQNEMDFAQDITVGPLQSQPSFKQETFDEVNIKMQVDNNFEQYNQIDKQDEYIDATCNNRQSFDAKDRHVDFAKETAQMLKPKSLTNANAKPIETEPKHSLRRTSGFGTLDLANTEDLTSDFDINDVGEYSVEFDDDEDEMWSGPFDNDDDRDRVLPVNENEQISMRQIDDDKRDGHFDDSAWAENSPLRRQSLIELNHVEGYNYRDSFDDAKRDALKGNNKHGAKREYEEDDYADMEFDKYDDKDDRLKSQIDEFDLLDKGLVVYMTVF